MSSGRIGLERDAVQSLMDLYEQAERCQQLHEQAHLPLPEPLKRFLGMSINGDRLGAVRPQIPPPERPAAPREAEPDWIWIDARQASPQSLVLALLRRSPAMRPRDLAQCIAELLPGVSRGTIANIGTRLQGEGTIERTDEGWKLRKPEAAGTLHDGLLWGPREIFSKQELAAHRRDAIHHVLRHYPAGLQTVQLVEQLQNCSWVQAPINKDLVKEDMKILDEAGKVRRRGNTRKWELAPAQDGRLTETRAGRKP